MWIGDIHFPAMLPEVTAPKIMKPPFLLLPLTLLACGTTIADTTGRAGFKTLQLSDEFHSERAALGDLNNDGKPDIAYGPFWFAGPDFSKRNLLYKPVPFAIRTYSNNFFSYIDDLDGDGWNDVLVMGFPGRRNGTYWLKNPGAGNAGTPWERFDVFDGVENESPVWADVTGDGKPEILCSLGGRFGFVAPADRANPDKPWQFTPITPPNSTGGKFTHGLGFGDVNGDGRTDLLEKSAWWEQPGSDGSWTRHAFPFAPAKGGAQMFAYDFDGDGDQDVLTSLDAHAYGLVWFEQQPGADGKISFQRHLIMGRDPAESAGGVVFSQLHGIALTDIDGDGIKDIVTGKRYFAHGGKDPGGNDPAVLYWFRTIREKGGKVRFVPRRIHANSGVGVDVTVGDADGDGRTDVVIGNKKGAFVHLQGNALAQPPAVTKTPDPGAPRGVILEGEGIRADLRGSGSVRPQNVAAIGPQWSGGEQLWWIDGKPGDSIQFPVNVPEGANYRLAVALTKAKDYGIVQFTLDGKELGKAIDLYNPDVLHTGEIVLVEKVAPGRRMLGINITGANPKAVKRHMFGLDYVAVRPEGEAAPKPPARKKPAAQAGKRLKAGNAQDANPLSAEEQRLMFKLPEGFEIELVADETSGVPKPVSLAFDGAGRLWTQTAIAYPNDKNSEIWKTPGKDRILVIDEPHLPRRHTPRVFASGMVMPMGVLPWGTGAYVAQGPEILYLGDSDGDGRADERKVLIRGFGVQDTHTLPHQLVRVPGGRVGFSQGVLSTGSVTDAGGQRVPFDRSLIATFEPDGTDLRVIGTGMNNIWAWAQDRLGRVFIHEANDRGFSLAEFEPDSSYPSFFVTKMHPAAPLHPQTAPGLGLGGTGFSGIAIADFRSGSFPAPWQDRYFVANPILGQIHSVTGVQGEDGVWAFQKQADLLTCDDPMFRPVAVAFGPDGCLYIADWYNRIISHNEVSRDHPARDKSRGRIWRIRHTSAARIPAGGITDFTTTPSPDLVAALSSDNTWAMRAAWHEIADRNAKELIPDLSKLASSPSTRADVRIIAIWALEELGHFDADLWGILLSDPQPYLRREAVRALHALGVPVSQASPLLTKYLGTETSWTVRYATLRYLRLADGIPSVGDRAMISAWNQGASTAAEGKNLTLDGSYQRAFQDFLAKMAVGKTKLPVFRQSKWDGTIAEHPAAADHAAVASRVKEITAKLPGANPTNGATLARGLCLTCHSIGDQGVGFAPPLDGSEARDLEGLITAIVAPNQAIEEVFRAYQIKTKDGETLEGFKAEETAEAITIKVMGGAKLSVPLAKVTKAGYVDGKSVMPDVTAGLTPDQVADIVAYLRDQGAG